MKVIKVENFLQKEFYFATVEDTDNRLDPLEMFSDSLMSITPIHKMSNVRMTIIKGGLGKEAAVAELIIQRKSNPGYKVKEVEPSLTPPKPEPVIVKSEPVEEKEEINKPIIKKDK